MPIADDIHRAIEEGVREAQAKGLYIAPRRFRQIVEASSKRVWDTLEDQLGAAQEALFMQLTAARTELSAVRRREEPLREMVAQLQAQLAAVRDAQEQKADTSGS